MNLSHRKLFSATILAMVALFILMFTSASADSPTQTTPVSSQVVASPTPTGKLPVTFLPKTGMNTVQPSPAPIGTGIFLTLLGVGMILLYRYKK